MNRGAPISLAKAVSVSLILLLFYAINGRSEDSVKLKEAAAHYSKGGEFMQAANDSTDPASLYARAIEEYKLSLYLNPEYSYAQYSMGQALKGAVRCSEALPYYEKAFAMFGAINSGELKLSLQSQALNNIKLCYEQLGKNEEAHKTLARELELQAPVNRAHVYSEISQGYLKDKNLPLAKANLLSALKVLEEHKTENGAGVWQRIILRHWDNACRYVFPVKECSEGVTFSEIAMPSRETDYSKMGRIKAIEAAYEKIKGNNYEPHMDTYQISWNVQELISLYVKENDYKRGVEVYKKAEAVYPFIRNYSFSGPRPGLWKIYQHYNRWDALLKDMESFYDTRDSGMEGEFGASMWVDASTPYLKAYVERLKRDGRKIKKKKSGTDIPRRWFIVLDENSLTGALQLKDGKPDSYGALARVGRDNYGASDNTYRFLVKFEIPKLEKSASLDEALLYAPDGDLGEVECVNVLDDSVDNRTNPGQIDQAAAALNSQVLMPSRNIRNGVFNLTGAVKTWLKDPVQNRGLLLKELYEENSYKRFAWHFNPSKIKLILVVSAKSRPSLANNEVLDCVETWASSYQQVWSDLSRGNMERARKRLEGVGNSVSDASLKIALEKQLTILRDYLGGNGLS